MAGRAKEVERPEAKSFHYRVGERLIKIVDSHNILHPRFIRMTKAGKNEIVPRPISENTNKPTTDESTKSK